MSVAKRLAAGILGLGLLALGCGKPAGRKDLAYTSGSPAFSVAYPDQWQPERPRFSGEVFRVTDPSQLPSLAINVYPGSNPAMIDGSYGDTFVNALKGLFPRAPDFKLVSSKVYALQDGTRAVESLCQWTWEDGSTRLASFNVSAVKDRNLVSVTCTGMQDTPPELLARYPHSLAFGK